jgi:hypothetical protein
MSIAASRYNYDNLTACREADFAHSESGHPGLFQGLGEKAFVGRTFTPEDAARMRNRRAVLSYDLWQKQFGGGEIIGKASRSTMCRMRSSASCRGHSRIRLTFLRSGAFSRMKAARIRLANARAWGVIGRMKAGVPASIAQAELRTIAARFARAIQNFIKDGISALLRCAIWWSAIIGKVCCSLWERPARPADYVRERRGSPIRARVYAPARSRDSPRARREPLGDCAQSLDRIASFRHARRNRRRPDRQLGFGFAPGQPLSRLDSARRRDRTQLPACSHVTGVTALVTGIVFGLFPPGMRPGSRRSIRCATAAKARPVCNRSGSAAHSSSRRSRSRSCSWFAPDSSGKVSPRSRA